MATAENGKGTPVKLSTSSQVVEVDPTQATVKLQSGEVVRGDLVIGADGVHVSLSWSSNKSKAQILIVHNAPNRGWGQDQAIRIWKECIQIPCSQG